MSLSAVLCMCCVRVCRGIATFGTLLIFQAEQRLSILPVYVMFVILIYRLTNAKHRCSCSEWELASGRASLDWTGLAGRAYTLLILQNCNMQANEPQNVHETTWL